jgi:hypothetical protein
VTEPAAAGEIVIDDLTSPRFTPEVAEMMALAAPMADALELTPDAVLAQAVAETGFDDFGGDGFREPLDALLAGLRTEAGLSPFGTINLHAQVLQCAKNRLLLQDLLIRHPEIRAVEVTAPIIVAGLPRTGTTHLHNLLAADPALRSLPYWESIEPLPAPGDGDDPSDPEPRRARTAAGVDFVDQAMPHFKAMHEMTTDHVHEEIQLLAMEFSTMFFETQARCPSYRDWYRSHDQTPHYEYLKTVLQALTFLRGGRRWVLKSPQHLEQFGVLRTVFPDATVVVTHRDPVAVVTSMLTMIAYTARLAVDVPDPVEVADYWVDRLGLMLDDCTRDRDLLDPDRSLDVVFDEFMADDLGTVARVYELADQPLDDRARAAHSSYLSTHQRNRHGTIRYDLTPFGVTADDLQARFASYTARFLTP